MFKNKFSIFVATFLIIGFFFLALPEKGYSGILAGGPPCCDFPEGNECIGGELGVSACSGGNCLGAGPCTLIEDAVCIPSGEEGGRCLSPAGVPAFNQWGLIAMAGILGIVGFMVMRRRKAVA